VNVKEALAGSCRALAKRGAAITAGGEFRPALRTRPAGSAETGRGYLTRFDLWRNPSFGRVAALTEGRAFSKVLL
jgi:hypothetical protein